MKLWRAMLKGSKVTNQFFGSLFDAAPNPTTACAMGAAFIGIGVPATLARIIPVMHYSNYFPILNSLSACPVDCNTCDKYGLDLIVTHLNDHHDWTREAIAEWIKTHEDALTRTKWNERKAKRQSSTVGQSLACIPEPSKQFVRTAHS